jgi:hypothetical protein
MSQTATTGLRMHRLIAFLGGLETDVGYHYSNTSVPHPPNTGERRNQSTPPPALRCHRFVIVHHPLHIKLACITSLKTRKLLPPPRVVLQAQTTAMTNSKIRRCYFSTQNIIQPSTTLTCASAYLNLSLRFLPKLLRQSTIPIFV